MTAREGRETALDRVAKALSSEAARTELYRYATSVAEAMPPDSSSWYVVGAVMQVNAVTRSELRTLAAQAKQGGTILAGLLQAAKWLPDARTIAIATEIQPRLLEEPDEQSDRITVILPISLLTQVDARVAALRRKKKVSVSGYIEAALRELLATGEHDIEALERYRISARRSVSKVR